MNEGKHARRKIEENKQRNKIKNKRKRSDEKNNNKSHGLEKCVINNLYIR